MNSGVRVQRRSAARGDLLPQMALRGARRAAQPLPSHPPQAPERQEALEAVTASRRQSAGVQWAGCVLVTSHVPPGDCKKEFRKFCTPRNRILDFV